MPYNPQLDIPVLSAPQGPNAESTYTHNHNNRFCYHFFGEKKTFEERKDARKFLNRAKGEIGRCVTFMRALQKDPNLTPQQKAVLATSIEQDEFLIGQIEDVKPAACTIL